MKKFARISHISGNHARNVAMRRFFGGEVIAFPTETSYGLGAHPYDTAAIDRLYAAKGRVDSHPLPLLVSGIDMARKIAGRLPLRAEQLMTSYWPGPLTIVVPMSALGETKLDARLYSDQGVALRHSAHPLAQALVLALQMPLPATSANRTGEPPLHSAAAVQQLFGDSVFVLDGGDASGDAPTTLVRVSAENRVLLLRQGALDLTVVL